MTKEHKEPEKIQVSQYCLDVTTVPNFLKNLPASLDIASIIWRAVLRKGRQKLAIPEKLKKTGITSAAMEAIPLNLRGSSPAMISKEKFKQNIALIAQHFSCPEEKFFVQAVTLMNKQKTATITFRRMYKQIRLPNDRRRKKLVLGMVKHDGNKDYHKMLASLSAKKITCTLMKTEKTIVMCSEEVVAKG